MTEAERTFYHVPVLLNEVIDLLDIKPGAWYIDATAGGGGHTRAMLDTGAKVLAIDRDQDAINYLLKQFKTDIYEQHLIVVKGNFAEIATIVKEQRINNIHGALFDLGLSTHQIKESGRGFSFMRDEPVDMRMDTSQRQTAADIVNTYSQGDLYELFIKLGEEQLARELVRALVRARTIKPIKRTKALSDLVEGVYREHDRKTTKHRATKVFQALRMTVNKELENFDKGLTSTMSVLPGRRQARLAVISFHSLEDRLVKVYFRKLADLGIVRVITKRPIRPSKHEIKQNKAARSAKLRVAEKL